MERGECWREAGRYRDGARLWTDRSDDPEIRLDEGAKRVIAVDRLPYRSLKAKRMNNVEIYNFEDYDDMGAYIREITKGGTDVVIDCVGMDGKKSTMEAIGQKLKLQGGTLSAIDIAIDAVRKYGTIQLTGVYGSLYNMFPLGHIFERNITLTMGQAPLSIICRSCSRRSPPGNSIRPRLYPTGFHWNKQAMPIGYLTIMKKTAPRWFSSRSAVSAKINQAPLSQPLSWIGDAWFCVPVHGILE